MEEPLRPEEQRLAPEEPMSTSPKPPDGEKPLTIRRGRVDSVDLYEVKDNELDLLENGPSSRVQLTFAVFLLSIAFSSIVALSTTKTFSSDIMKTLHVVVAVVGILLGIYLLVVWYHRRSNIGEVVATIRGRIPPEGHSVPQGGPVGESHPDEEPGPPRQGR